MGTIDKAEERPWGGVILLSGFVFPGVGQLLQRRWLAAGLFAGIFFSLFGLLLSQCYRSIMAFYQLGIDQIVSKEELPSPAWILGLLGACLVVHLVNIGDVYRAHRRAAHRSAVKRHLDPLLASVLEEDEQVLNKS